MYLEEVKRLVCSEHSRDTGDCVLPGECALEIIFYRLPFSLHASSGTFLQQKVADYCLTMEITRHFMNLHFPCLDPLSLTLCILKDVEIW